MVYWRFLASKTEQEILVVYEAAVPTNREKKLENIGTHLTVFTNTALLNILDHWGWRRNQ